MLHMYCEGPGESRLLKRACWEELLRGPRAACWRPAEMEMGEHRAAET